MIGWVGEKTPERRVGTWYRVNKDAVALLEAVKDYLVSPILELAIRSYLARNLGMWNSWPTTFIPEKKISSLIGISYIRQKRYEKQLTDDL